MAAGVVRKFTLILMLVALIALTATVESYSTTFLLILAGIAVLGAMVLLTQYSDVPRESKILLFAVFFLAALVFSYFLPRPFFTLPLFISGLGLAMSAYSLAMSLERAKNPAETEGPETVHQVTIEHLPEVTPMEVDEKLHPYVASRKGKIYHVPDCPMIIRVKKKNLMRLDAYQAQKHKMEQCACVKMYTWH